MDIRKLMKDRNNAHEEWFNETFNKKKLEEDISRLNVFGYTSGILHTFGSENVSQDLMMNDPRTIDKLQEWFPDFIIMINEETKSFLANTLIEKKLVIDWENLVKKH